MTDYFGNALITRCDGHVKCYVLLTPTGIISDHVHDGFVSVNATKLLQDALMDSRCNLSGSGWGQNLGYGLWKPGPTQVHPHTANGCWKMQKHFPSLNTNNTINRYYHTWPNNHDFMDILQICCTVSLFNVFLVNKSGFATCIWVVAECILTQYC